MRTNAAKPPYIKILLPLNGRQKPVKCSCKADTGSIVLIKEESYLVIRCNDLSLVECDGFIKVTTDSMQPSIDNDCWIGISRLKHKHLLNYGYTYLIITSSLKAILCKVFPGKKDSIKLVFDNKKHAPLIIKRTDIKAVLNVECIISAKGESNMFENELFLYQKRTG